MEQGHQRRDLDARASGAEARAIVDADIDDEDVEHGCDDPHVPLLSVSAHKKADAAAQQPSVRVAQRWKILVLIFAIMALAVHIFFVVLLRKTTFTLEQLTIPDLCHRQSKGTIVLEFQNPSYCSPDVGPLRISFSKNETAFFELTLPRFELASGKLMLVSNVNFKMLTTPEVLHQLVFSDDRGFEVTGTVPIRISCMLLPFTVKLNLRSLFHETPSPPPLRKSLLSEPHFDNDLPEEQAMLSQSGVPNGIKDELERLVAQILKTIALSNIHVESDSDQIFAYTDVTFDYVSRVLWNLPSLTIHVSSESKETILLAGFKRFLLGNGKTFISAFTDITKSQSSPLQKMLQQYLGGNDIALHVQGGNRGTSCFSLQVLDLMGVKVQIPAKVNGKPAFLRRSEVHPTLKQLDSITRKCLLELEVLITINNPLPIHFDLFSIEFDLLYKNADGSSKDATFLLHVDDQNHTAWTPHTENNLTLSTQVRDFDMCAGVIGLYLRDHLAFEIQHGRIAIGAGSGNFSIPFSVKEIHIHPSESLAVDDINTSELLADA
ncbi:hypothetical protein Gpo141_00009676 [Globisporangium polare]